jgi:hypothetical protein
VLQGSAGAPRVELVLRLVQAVEKVDGGVPGHSWHPCRYRWMPGSRTNRTIGRCTGATPTHTARAMGLCCLQERGVEQRVLLAQEQQLGREPDA